LICLLNWLRSAVIYQYLLFSSCRGRGRKKGGDAATLGWDWDQQRGVIAKGLSGVAEVDLVRLWQPEPVEDAFVQRWLQTVRRHIAAPSIIAVIASAETAQAERAQAAVP